MSTPLNTSALEQTFTHARTFNAFTDRAVTDETLFALYELAKWGPTSMNTQPARIVFVRSAEAKAKLLPALLPGNAEKTKAAPVCALVAMDSRFYDHLPEQFPATNAKPMFEGNAGLAESTAFRNSSLQAAYLIVAARQLGLDCGPMSGFDPAKINEAFFPDGRYKINLLINLGYGDATGNFPRGPRLPFEVVARIE